MSDTPKPPQEQPEISLPPSASSEKQPKKKKASGRPFKKGQSGNPDGRPPKFETAREAFDAALKIAQKGRKYPLMVHAIREAYTDNKVLVAVLKKMVPDLTEDMTDPSKKVGTKVIVLQPVNAQGQKIAALPPMRVEVSNGVVKNGNGNGAHK